MLKYLQYSLSFLPLIFIVGFIYLSYTVPAFKYVELALIAGGIGYIGYAYFNTKRLTKNIEQGQNLPKVFTDFPIYETSKSEYRLTRQKVECFILSVEAGQAAEVELNANEINCLRVKGQTPVKSGTSSNLSLPEYYEIRNGKIFEYSIAFAPFISLSGFWSFLYEIDFSRQDEQFFETRKMIRQDGKELPSKNQSSIIKRLLNGKFIPIILRLDKTLEWSDSMNLVISKLQNIEVVEDRLILRA
jgi:hypothetical protein